LSRTLQYTLVDGIRCYSPSKLQDYTDYPDAGFDVTEENASTSFWITSRNRIFHHLIMQALRRTGGHSLLEIGCGNGDLLRRLSEEPDVQLTGSEIYLKGLKYSQAKLPLVDFIQFDASEGVTGERFDVIAAFDVLEHIEDDRATMANIFEMLSENGRLVLSVPQYMFLWSNLDEIVFHKRRYSRREMIQKLTNSGFVIERTTSFVFVLFPLMFVSRLLDRKIKPTANDGHALDRRVRFSRFTNSLFDAVMRIDEFLIRLGLSLPFGGTLVFVAKKPSI
jgi:SAM-dependent methyltransferase